MGGRNAVVVITLLGAARVLRPDRGQGRAHPIVGFGLAAGAALPLIVAYVGNEYHATLLMTATLLAP